ncbi:hypothetical protein [Shinella pollutisoli]|uniref:Uncharacterized protein n=1 Tax=Shinella pollutisoli TaxID=2250594 RepID=A0ABV7DKI0_9HYPH|nr:hypothetical protein [Shinella pollutisoli]
MDINDKRRKQAHLWARDTLDWYVEPHECSRALFRVEEFQGTIWDPACGFGRIVQQARSLDKIAIGSDIVKRGDICDFTADFFSMESFPDFENIITNPPFGRAEEFVRRALEIIPPHGKVAAILPIVWLAGFSTKRHWLPKSPLCKVYPISPRPSMPPGLVIEAGIKPGNGTKDYCWLVWKRDYIGKAEVIFLNTKHAREEVDFLGF